VTKSGPGAGSIPLDGLASLVYTNAQSQTVSNRITTAGYEYDPAGNQTRGQTENGTWRRYKYDSAGRLAVALDDSSNPQETYSYGASNERLLTVYGNGLGAPATYYAWEGGQVIADFRAGTSNNLVWEKSYVYLGGACWRRGTFSTNAENYNDSFNSVLILPSFPHFGVAQEHSVSRKARNNQSLNPVQKSAFDQIAANERSKRQDKQVNGTRSFAVVDQMFGGKRSVCQHAAMVIAEVICRVMQ
jgi:YD repeat-containing protein